MNTTKIEWTDRSWNPVTGCLNGCPYCYAKVLYERFGRSFEPTFHPERLQEPSSISRSTSKSKIFVCSVADLFGDWVPDGWIESVLSIVRKTPHLTFQFLTKNPERLSLFNPWPRNCWVGATATNQIQWDRAMALQKADAPVRFISAEPLLSEIVPCNWFPDWLIIGACTGKCAMQPELNWVSILEQNARQVGSPIFHKPNLTIPHEHLKQFPAVLQAATLFSNMAAK